MKTLLFEITIYHRTFETNSDIFQKRCQTVLAYKLDSHTNNQGRINFNIFSTKVVIAQSCRDICQAYDVNPKNVDTTTW